MKCKNCQQSFSDDLNYCPYCGFQARALGGQEAPETYEDQLARHRAREQDALGETRLLGPIQEELREQGYIPRDEPLDEPQFEVPFDYTDTLADDDYSDDDEEALIEEARRLEKSEQIAASHRAIATREERARAKYEEKSPEKRPGVLRSFWKPRYTAIIATAIILLSVYFIAIRMYQGSVYAFSETLNRNMYPEAGRQYDRFLSEDQDDRQKANNVLDTYLASLQDRYLRGDMMYAEMISALEHMTATDLYQDPLSVSIDLFRQQTVNWQQTEQVYQNALTAASQNLYADAIRGFNDVLFRAGNYKDVGVQLASVRNSYRSYLEQEIKPFQDQGNYTEAARRLQLAAELMPDDQGIADMMQRNQLLEIIELRSETREAVAVLQYQDDYREAFETVYEALDKAPTDEVLLELNRQLREGYAEHIIRAADVLLTSGQFEEAKQRIEEGLVLLPGHEGLREAMLAFDADAELPDPNTDRGLRYLLAAPDPDPDPVAPLSPTPVPEPTTEPATEPTAQPTTPMSTEPETTPETTPVTTGTTTTTTEQTTATPEPETSESITATSETSTESSTETEPSETSQSTTETVEPTQDGFIGPLGNQTATDAAGEIHTNSYVYRAGRPEAVRDGPREIVIPVNGQASRLVGSIAIGGNEELYTQTFVGIYLGGGGTADWAGSLSYLNNQAAEDQQYRKDIDFSLEGIDTIWIYVETLQGADVTTILDLEILP